ncbi:21043_t:CDS:2, partial [Gigaspora margarita]
KIIASLLDKPYRKVKLDKLLEKKVRNTETSRKYTNPKQQLKKNGTRVWMKKFLKKNRAASTAVHKVFRKFLSLCICLGKIPKKWKLVSIYLIPKKKEWNYSLANVRSIALLETFQKCMTKIYTDRLASIMINKNILRGPNFAGLPGNSTE